MRHLIIKSLDVIIWIVAGIITIAGVGAGLMAISQGQLVGLAMIIGAPIYAIIFAGMFFLVIGIYDNTKRTAEALEGGAGRG
ncbi:MAG: hypothetical protein ACE5FS_12435 [Paracoccaceae bacterium]